MNLLKKKIHYILVKAENDGRKYNKKSQKNTISSQPRSTHYNITGWKITNCQTLYKERIKTSLLERVWKCLTVFEIFFLLFFLR